jgi:hypothetical protein
MAFGFEVRFQTRALDTCRLQEAVGLDIQQTVLEAGVHPAHHHYLSGLNISAQLMICHESFRRRVQPGCLLHLLELPLGQQAIPPLSIRDNKQISKVFKLTCSPTFELAGVSASYLDLIISSVGQSRS